MSENDWCNLQIGDRVNSARNIGCANMIVSEICTDEKSLSKWREKGHKDVNRLIKFSVEGSGYHTWDVDHNKWTTI
jgi:hypothetical protein